MPKRSTDTIRKEGEVLENDSDFGLNSETGEQEETPASSSEENTEDNDPSQEGDTTEAPAVNTPDETNVDFHKHPAWKEREALWHKREQDWQEKMSTLEKSVQELAAARKETPANSPAPQWFRGVYGDDEEAWKDYQSHQRSIIETAKREVVEEQRRAAQEVTQRQKQWEDYSNRQMDSLEGEGNKFDRTELKALVEKYSPIDANGNADYRKGLEIYNLTQSAKPKPSIAAKKKAADIDSTDSDAEPSSKEYVTSEDLRGRDIMDWRY